MLKRKRSALGSKKGDLALGSTIPSSGSARKKGRVDKPAETAVEVEIEPPTTSKEKTKTKAKTKSQPKAKPKPKSRKSGARTRPETTTKRLISSQDDLGWKTISVPLSMFDVDASTTPTSTGGGGKKGRQVDIGMEGFMGLEEVEGVEVVYEEGETGRVARFNVSFSFFGVFFWWIEVGCF